jgi:hypothetical protein
MPFSPPFRSRYEIELLYFPNEIIEGYRVECEFELSMKREGEKTWSGLFIAQSSLITNVVKLN